MMRFVLMAVILLVGLSGCMQQKKIKKSGRVVKIGVLAPQSRENRKYGIQSLMGINFANKEQRFLDNGDEIVLEVIDTNSSQEGTKSAFKALLDKNVTAVISFVGSQNTIGLKDILKKSHTPFLATLATNNEISRLSDDVVQVCMNNKDEALVAAHFIKDEKFVNRVGLIYDQDNAYSRALAEEFALYYKKIRGDIAFYIDISKEGSLQELQEQDFSKVKMIFGTAGVKGSIKALKILKAKKSVEFLASDGLLSSAKESMKSDLNLLNGIYIVEHYASDIKKSRAYRKLQKILKKEELEGSSYAFLAYDSYQLLRYVLNNCQKYDKECMRALFHNSDVIRGIAGNFSMIEGRAQREIYIDEIENLRLKKVIISY
jgi:ABC-type branched-subunit amino acid transport system substrate-binding protein